MENRERIARARQVLAKTQPVLVQRAGLCLLIWSKYVTAMKERVSGASDAEIAAELLAWDAEELKARGLSQRRTATLSRVDGD